IFGNKLIERHNLERCLGGAGLLQHKDTESKTTSKCYGFVSSLRLRLSLVRVCLSSSPRSFGFRHA
ncbi:hypothetical protein, partial [Roseibium litorale]|uniref:hypothetical protein n=1 Tax=Roseibium litorale TaxID=2803841 RepID=UPI001AD8F1E6